MTIRTLNPKKSYAAAAKKLTSIHFGANCDYMAKRISTPQKGYKWPKYTKNPYYTQSSKGSQSRSGVHLDKPKPVPEKKEDKFVEIKRSSNQNPKGSEDPITQYNQFQALNQEGEEENMITDIIPPTPTPKQKPQTSK